MALAGITPAENSTSQVSATVAAVNAPAQTAAASSNTSKAAVASTAVYETVDTVTLLGKSQKDISETRTEKTVKEENKNNNDARSASDVLFDYNAKGDLRIKFMDSGNRLIYQTPPVLFAKIADLMSQSQSVVDTKA